VIVITDRARAAGNFGWNVTGRGRLRDKEKVMKAKLLLAAVAGLSAAALGLFATTAAEAQRKNPPYDLYCRDQSLGRASGTVQICMAYTLQQCLASRTSPGESCYLNPRYDPRLRR
jgi:hypothetical protein